MVKMDMVNERHKSLDANDLKNVSQIWKYFIYPSLMHTNHYRKVDGERAILLYAIQSTKIMDVRTI